MKLLVEGMTCEHCVRTITSALHQLDSTAQVHIDLVDAAVRIPVSRLAPAAAVKAVQEAGYAARVVDDVGHHTVAPIAKRCSGTCHT